MSVIKAGKRKEGPEIEKTRTPIRSLYATAAEKALIGDPYQPHGNALIHTDPHRYYSIFATLYATALLFCQEIMTNSSWTQAHIQSLLAKGKKSWLAGLLLMDDLSERKRRERGERGESDQAAEQIERCKVLFPPCDTGDLARFGLEGRGERRGIVSLAQFRYVFCPSWFLIGQVSDRSIGNWRYRRARG